MGSQPERARRAGDADRPSLEKTLEAKTHLAYLVGSGKAEAAPMERHTDAEIERLLRRSAKN